MPFVALPKQVHLITGLICAFIAVIIVCALFSNRGTLPLTVTGYSISPDGCPIASEMTLKHDVPVSVFESNTEPEEYAFAFSYPNITDDTECQDIFVYSSSYIPNSNLESVDYDYLKNFSLPKDENIYVYYIVQSENDEYEFTYYVFNTDKNEAYDINISIYKKDDSYFAHLNSIELSEYEFKSVSVDQKTEIITIDGLDELLIPYQEIIDKLNEENNWSLAIDENSRQKFYESYKDYSLEEFEAFLRKDMSDLGY